MRFRVVCFVVVLLALLGHGGGSARAQAPSVSSAPARPVPSASSAPAPVSPAPSGSAAASADSRPAPAVPPEVAELQTRARQIRELLAGSLDPGVSPTALFELRLEDEAGIGVEVERLRAVVARAGLEPAAAEPSAPSGAGSAHPQALPAPSGSASAAPSAQPRAPGLDPERWRAQLALDRARLAFYQLPKAEREALLAKHAERQKIDREARSKRDISEAERKADEAEQQRLDALEEAKRARSEAARLVAEEHARLLGIKKRQAEFEAELLERQAALDKRQEALLKLRRRVREAIAARLAGADPAAADEMYDEVRAALRPAREALADATHAFASSDLGVPGPGDDPLLNLPVDVERSAATRARKQVQSTASSLAQRERALRAARAKQLSDEVERLNADRLALLDVVSPEKREAVMGFGASGVDQAAAEVRQVQVILGYHLTATTRWLADIRSSQASRGKSALTGLFVAVKWLVPALAFVWWRRRAVRVLEQLRTTIHEHERRVRGRAAGPTLAERSIEFSLRVRSPLEWLLFLSVVVWLLPVEAQSLLEVQLVQTIFTWTLCGAVAVQVVDFFAGAEADRRLRRSRLHTDLLRLRSLRLVSHVIVGFGLVLALTSQLVGEGTIHRWVWSFCWFAAIPVVLTLVRWWRAIIFALVDQKRKQSAVEEWVVGNRSGWTSFPAAFVGGCVLLWRGLYRAVVSRVSKLTLTRRVLAYLFSREIGKKAELETKVAYRPLSPELLALLGPETASGVLVPSAADEAVREVIEHVRRSGGGVYAVVGERGMGKTRLLREIREGIGDATLIQCPFGGMEAFAQRFLSELQAAQDAKLEEVAARIDADDRESALLLDDAHRLIQPQLGGLRSFDRVLSLARAYSKNACWVFAFDVVIWRFFERMRGAKPLFDEVVHILPWGEEPVARLLEERCAEAHITPDFSALLPELPADADEADIEEALERTQASYYRLIWDYAGGNPGVALHAFRSSLGISADGTAAIKFFTPPRLSELEQLPDNAVFVLRSLVQLEEASEADICAATSIPPAQVGDAIRFGLARGYIARTRSGEYTVTWNWFRQVTRFLQRRHLLFAG